MPLASGMGLVLQATAPGLGHRVAPPGLHPWPWPLGHGVAPPSRPRPLTSFVEYLLSAAAPDLGHGVAPLGRHP